MKTECHNTMLERHYSPAVLAEIWGYSPDTIVRLFEDVPGVLKYGEMGGRGKRRKITMRIPHSVAEVVYQEHTK